MKEEDGVELAGCDGSGSGVRVDRLACLSASGAVSVYVDDAQNKMGRMSMCHMVADTTEELVGMAERIGVSAKWLQRKGTHHEHFDVCWSRRKLAIKAGARSVTTRELVAIIAARGNGVGN